MRTLLVGSVLFSTLLLHAQTRTNGQSVTMEATNSTSAGMPAPIAGVPDVRALNPDRPISTGVIAPKLLTSPKIVVAKSDFREDDLSSEKAVVSFKVDAYGTPHHVQIIKSVNPEVDSKVVAAVSAWHFTPATLDDQAVPINLNLVVQFQAAK